MQSTVQVLIAMVIYMSAVVLIGILFARRANKNSHEYFLGGRSLGPWVTAMSAEASDMSGWLLMGLPGVAYWCGISDAAWTAIGLAVGTYLNWLIVSKRLRRYSESAGEAITLPEFFSNRFHEKRKVIMTIAAAFILIFFTVYASSCFVTCGKLFSTLFDMPYIPMMIVGAIFVLVYTVLGGFLAESISDFMQAIVMIIALTLVVVLGTVSAGGLNAVIDNAKSIPGFFDFFGIATPTTVDGVQQAVNGVPQFGAAGTYSILSIASCMAWGLGYFGMPQVLLRFMAIRSEGELTRSRRIATVWVVISLGVAVLIGIIGYSMSLAGSIPMFGDKSTAESIIVEISNALSKYGIFFALIAGVILAGILASTMSTADSQLLAASSSVSHNIVSGVFGVKTSPKTSVIIARVTLLVISVVGIILALDPKSSVFDIVSFAWAGFGATFGPVVLFALFWKRSNRYGALAGMISGGVMVFVWKYVIAKLGGVFAIYELLPAFLIACIAIVVVSLLTPAPEQEIQDEFSEVAAMK